MEENDTGEVKAVSDMPTSPAVQQTAGMTRAMTFGEKAVGLTFNPGSNVQVQSIKEKFAAIIDELNNLKPVYDGKPNEVSRMLAIAITEAQTAQMWAVKAVTWQF